jgi:hypothetical protein
LPFRLPNDEETVVRQEKSVQALEHNGYEVQDELKKQTGLSHKAKVLTHRGDDVHVFEKAESYQNVNNNY